MQAPASSVRLGTDEEGSPILLEDRQRAQHTYILGKSGVGKTMLLVSIVLQDLHRGVPVVFLDLIGTGVPYLRQALAAINLSGMAAERGVYPALNQRLRQERETFFGGIRIVDLDTVEPQDRFNPLDVVPGMTTAELAEAFAAAIERMLGGKLTEMRALHLNLVGLASVVIDTGGGTVEDLVELSCTGTESFREYMRRLERKRAEGRLRVPVRPDLVTRYMSEFFSATSGRERRELSASTLRALAIILSDPVAKRFLSSPRGNLDLAAVMQDGHSILVNMPPHNLHTQTVISSLILGRLSATAMRRSSQDVIEGRVPQVHVIVDEFQRCFSQEMAEDLAVLRNKGVSMICAHQSSNQPPFHTTEGQAMLHSVRDNCSTKIIMRVGPKDGQELAGEVFAPRGHLVKRQTQEVTHTASESAGTTNSRAEAQGATQTEGESQTRTRTQSTSQAQGISKSDSEGTQTTRTHGKTQARTEGQSEGSSHTITHGVTEGSSFTRTAGRSESHGASRGAGTSHTMGTGHSTGLQETRGDGVGRHSEGGYQVQRNQSLGRTTGESTSENQSRSSSHSENHTRGRSQSEARGQSQSHSRSEAHGRTAARSSSRSIGTSQSSSEGKSRTHTQGQSQTQTQGRSHGTSHGTTHSQAVSQTRTTTEGNSRSHSHGTSLREVTEYYSVMEEQIVRGYELQNLPNRRAIVLRQGDGESTTQRMQTLDLPLELVTRVGPLDGLADLNERIAPPPAEPEPTLGIVDRLRAQQHGRLEEEDD